MCYSCGHQLRDVEPEEMSEAPSDQEADAESSEEDEVSCPKCKTLVSKSAIMCYACGSDLRGAQPAADGEGSRDEAKVPEEQKKPQVFVKKIVKKKVA